MKVYILSIIILLTFVLKSQVAIDFNQKRIAKFIKKTYKVNDFEKSRFVIKTEWPYQGNFFYLESNNDTLGISYIGRVNSCRAGGCSIDNTNNDGSFEYFDYVILFNLNKTVKAIKVYNYQASHGYEITAKSWLKQFNGSGNHKVLEVGKDIDAISGATISVYAITEDINTIINYLNKVELIFEI